MDLRGQLSDGNQYSLGAYPHGSGYCPGKGVQCLKSRILAFIFILFAMPVLAQPEGKIEIEVPLFAAGYGLDFFKYAAEEYEKVRPEVEVNIYGDPRIDEKVRVRIIEGSEPDITNASLQYQMLIHKGVFMPLDKYLDQPSWEGDTTWRETFLDGTLERTTIEGKAYGIPFSYATMVIWYNRGMFRRHGWEPPRTWKEFLTLCEEIQNTGISPMAFQGRYFTYALYILDATVYRIIGKEGCQAMERLEPGCYTHPGYIKALDLIQRMSQYFQPGCMGMSHTEAQLQFFLGNTAMVFCGAWLKSEMEGKIPEDFELGCFNIPHVEGGKGLPNATYSRSGYYYIFSNAPHPDEAADFLRFMTSKRMSGEFARRRDVPVSIKGANQGNLSPALAELEEIIGRSTLSFDFATTRLYSEIGRHRFDNIYNLLNDRITPEQFSADMERTAAAGRRLLKKPDYIDYVYIWKPVILLTILGAAILYTAITQIQKVRRRRVRVVVKNVTRSCRFGMLLVFLSPAVILYTVFVIAPSLTAFARCLQEWDGITDPRFVGLLNFKRILFEDPSFWIAIGNNLFLMFVPSIFVISLALLFAACISRGVKGHALFRVTFFFPNIIGVVAASLLWLHIYNPQGGLANTALINLGLGLDYIGLDSIGQWFQDFQGHAWLSQDNLYWAIIPMAIWGGVGFNMILFLAGMESIPKSLYESADIDGAGPFAQFRHVTFPLIREQFTVAIVFLVIAGMKAFGVIWLLTNQRPQTKTHVLGTLLVRELFTTARVGQATALAVILFFIVFFGTVATMRLLRRETIEM
jgi:raffinose/stachyose/melibiose transport system permease protein